MKKREIIDKLVQSGSYANSDITDIRAWYMRCNGADLEITPAQERHEEASNVDGELRTAIRYMALIIVILVILNLLGVSSVWELFF